LTDKNKDKSDKPLPSKIPRGMTIIFLVLAGVFLLTMFMNSRGNSTQEIDYAQFLEYLEEGRVERVEVRGDRLRIILTSTTPAAPRPQPEDDSFARNLGNMLATQNAETLARRELAERTFYTGRMPDPDLLDRLRYHNVEYSSPIVNYNWLFSMFMNFGFFILIIVIFMFVMRRIVGGRGGIMSMGQSNAKVHMEKRTGVTFDDVAGQDEAKESMMELVDLLHHPEKYAEIGAVQPKGALLVGPPGTGKTLLAKAVAGEANVVFFSLSGSDFIEMFMGVGASRMRDLFKQAAQNTPCIIFIDEIDTIGKSRDNSFGNASEDRENTLTQLLSEMDGFDSTKGVVILGATNRPDTLDKALLRPGRFDRRINVELPDLKGREAILQVHAKKVKLGPDVDLSRIAKITSGSAGADLANMINEAAINAVRMKRTKVNQEDLLEAIEVVIAGKEKKDRIMSEKEKRIVAFHEIGHAIARAVQRATKPVEKITIIPRTKGSLGYVLSAPEEERFIQTKEELLSEIICCLAGRAAEEVEFDTQTTGVGSDVEQATRIARAMVSMYGMSEKYGMMGLESIQNRYLDGRSVLNVSDQTGAGLDEEVRKILDDCYKRAVEILKEKHDIMREIAEFLVAKETLTGDEFMDMYEGKKDDFPQLY